MPRRMTICPRSVSRALWQAGASFVASQEESMENEQILIRVNGAVGTITLNRPQAMNALSPALMAELVEALEEFDRTPAIRCIVITGSDRAFAAGADIRTMAEANPVELLLNQQAERWQRIRRISKPLVAAVAGYALGGGCELAMCCDLIVAAETARFGQPEVKVGIMPGAGGTQRLARLVGKHRAMEMVLMGRLLTAHEAERVGLVNKVVPAELVLEEAEKVAHAIATRSPLAVRLAKESILNAYETPLSAGLEHERKSFYLLFATEDQKEGMRAFIEKREPTFQGQ